MITYLKVVWGYHGTKKGNKHNDTKELNLKEFVYVGESLEKTVWLHNKAYTFAMKILGHTEYINSVIYKETSSTGIALILLWVWCYVCTSLLGC